MSHLFSRGQDKKSRFLEMNRRFEIHDVIVTKILNDWMGLNGFCKGLAELERKAQILVEKNWVVSIEIEDSDEAAILRDFFRLKI